MRVAIKLLENERAVQHRVRGTGVYIENLRKALERQDRQYKQSFSSNEYIFFTREQNLPGNVNLVHYPYFEPFFLTLPLKKVAPTVVTVHDLIPLVFPEHFPAGIKGFLKWQIQKFSLRGCQAIITDSESSKRDIIKYAGISEDKIHVVYLAPGEEFKKLPIGVWSLELKKKYHLPDTFILCVGDATWNKNLPRLIEAAKQINIPLVMVGKALAEEGFDRTNPWNQDLVKIANLCQNNQLVLRPGFVPDGDLVGLYNLATVFTMPSLYEGFGLPVLEAMACGCPVVTSRAGSLAEVAGEAGLSVNPEKTEEIAEGLLRGLRLSHEEREKMIAKGLEQAEKFSWDKTAQRILAVYQKVYSL